MNGKIDFSKAKLLNQFWENEKDYINPLIDIAIVDPSRLHPEGSLAFRVNINKFSENQRKTLFSIGETLESRQSPFLLEVLNTFTQDILGVDYYVIQTKIPYQKTLSKYHTDYRCMEEYVFELYNVIGCYEFTLELDLPLSVCTDDISVALIKNKTSPFPQICLTPYSFLRSFIDQINNVPVHIHSSFSGIFTIFDLTLSPLFDVKSCFPEVNDLIIQDLNATEAIKTNEFLSNIRKVINVPTFDIYSLTFTDFCGRGSYGSVFKMEGNDRKLFAMKESPKNKTDLLFKESFVLNSMDHKNIVKCYGYCEENFSFEKPANKIYPHGFMLMEYCEEGDLENLVNGHFENKKRFTIEEIETMFGQIALACLYVHFNKRYVHRDLKLANILVKSHEPFIQIKLCDFGFARSSDVEMKTVVGTPICCDPRILKHKEFDDRCDLFSLGCILYYLLYGKYPCQDCDSIHEIIIKIGDKNIGFERDHVHNTPFNEVVDLIGDLMNLSDKNMTWEQFRNHPFIVKSVKLVEEKYKSL